MLPYQLGQSQHQGGHESRLPARLRQREPTQILRVLSCEAIVLAAPLAHAGVLQILPLLNRLLVMPHDMQHHLLYTWGTPLNLPQTQQIEAILASAEHCQLLRVLVPMTTMRLHQREPPDRGGYS